LNLEVEMEKSNIVENPAHREGEQSYKWGSISLPKPICDECKAHATYRIDHKLNVGLFGDVEEKS